MIAPFLLPLLHASVAPNTPFLAAWSFDPLITVGLLLLAFGYGLALYQLRQRGRRPMPVWQPISFYAGWLTLVVALLGPLDSFNDELFSMHMLQHLALMQIAAPLILLGRPVQLILRALSPGSSKAVARFIGGRGAVRGLLTILAAPAVATILFNLNMVIWHVPNFYDAALSSDGVHALEHSLFLGLAFLFWWPIIDPVPRHHRAHPAWALGAVFASMVVGMGLGAILTLSHSIIYPSYLSTPKPWGLSPLDDQQIGGLSMWVGGGLLYMGILVAILIRTFGTGDESDVVIAEPAQPSRASEPA